MFTEIANGWNSSRFSGVINNYYVMVQLSKTDSRYGIANGKITRFLMYPSVHKTQNPKIVVFDHGWKESIPDQESIRKIIERTVRYFEGVRIDWQYEERHRSMSEPLYNHSKVGTY